MTGQCPDRETLSAYLDREANPSEERRVDLHLVPRGATFTGARVFPSVDGEKPVVAEQERKPATPVAAASGAGREVIARAR